MWVTRHPKRGGGGLKCADEYVRRRGVPSVALELGVRGFSPQARSRVWRSLIRVINALSEIHQDEVTLEAIAEQQPDLMFYETHTRYTFDHPALTLIPGWVNFSTVKEGTPLTVIAELEVEAKGNGGRGQASTRSPDASQSVDLGKGERRQNDPKGDQELSDTARPLVSSPDQAQEALSAPATHLSSAQMTGVESRPNLARYARVSGALLFPKYPPRDPEGVAFEPRPKELCRIITQLHEHPNVLWGDATDDDT